MEQNKKDNSKRVMVVLDFDETFAQEHLFHFLYQSKNLFTEDAIINHIFGGQERIKKLIKFCFKEL